MTTPITTIDEARAALDAAIADAEATASQAAREAAVAEAKTTIAWTALGNLIRLRDRMNPVAAEGGEA